MTRSAFDLRGIEKSYRHFRLQDLHLALPEGSIMGFIGPNGAGKSTTIRILMGLVRRDAGAVEVLGLPMPARQCAIKREVGFVSEDMRLYPGATIEWHMRLVRSFCPGWNEGHAATLLSRFGLVAGQKVKGLSHGQRVKAALLLALARRPRLLILDEPTTGLDPVVRHEVLSELLDVLREEGRSVVFSSHHTQDVEQISDRVTFIDGGRILETDEKGRFLERWRRLRFQIDDDGKLELPGEGHDLAGDGRARVLITAHFSDDLVGRLRAAGAAALQVERMTLEEIFLARVQMGRRRRAA